MAPMRDSSEGAGNAPLSGVAFARRVKSARQVHTRNEGTCCLWGSIGSAHAGAAPCGRPMNSQSWRVPPPPRPLQRRQDQRPQTGGDSYEKKCHLHAPGRHHRFALRLYGNPDVRRGARTASACGRTATHRCPESGPLAVGDFRRNRDRTGRASVQGQVVNRTSGARRSPRVHAVCTSCCTRLVLVGHR